MSLINVRLMLTGNIFELQLLVIQWQNNFMRMNMARDHDRD